MRVEDFITDCLRSECRRLMADRSASQQAIVARAFPRGIEGSAQPELKHLLALIYRTVQQEQAAQPAGVAP